MVDFVSAGIIAVIMALTILCDLRFMRIPNWLSIIGLISFVCLISWTLTWDEVLWRTGISFATLVIGIALFAIGAFGAGDVKILSVLLLFVPTDQYAMFFLTLSGCLVMSIAAVSVARKFLEQGTSSWAFLRNEKRLPMGLAIGAAGLISLLG